MTCATASSATPPTVGPRISLFGSWRPGAARISAGVAPNDRTPMSCGVPCLACGVGCGLLLAPPRYAALLSCICMGLFVDGIGTIGSEHRTAPRAGRPNSDARREAMCSFSVWIISTSLETYEARKAT